jgi:PIN domain nuclease of toxin-antitoxin system
VTDAVVLDASAVLALIHGEPGSEAVEALDAPPFLSAVNATEVLSMLGRAGIPATRAGAILEAMQLRIVPFVPELAGPTAALHARSRKIGLSLGDAACLATAAAMNAVVYTADQAWRRLNLDIEIRFIR